MLLILCPCNYTNIFRKSYTTTIF